MSPVFSAAAVITAGFTPREDDPLVEVTQGRSKALIPIAGKPMIAHVVDVLAASRYIQHVVIVALDPSAEVRFSVPVALVPDAGSMIGNISAGLDYALEHYPETDGMLLSGSDVPTISPPIVDAFIEECLRTDHDMYYSIVERSVMEARFPNSRRSYVHLKDGDFAGGDLLLFRRSASIGHQELWDRLSSSRKNALRQASMFGVGTFLKLATRRLTIADAEKRALQVLGVRGRGVPFPYAEVAMDVDKPFQLEIVRAELEGRSSASPQP